jgi:hypothetical protein
VLEAPGKITFTTRPAGGPPTNSTRYRSGDPSGSSNTPSRRRRSGSAGKRRRKGVGVGRRPAGRPEGRAVRARLALYWLALYRRRRMLFGLALGMVAFETLIIVIIRTIPQRRCLRLDPPAPERVPGLLRLQRGGVAGLHPGLVGAGLVHPFWIAMQLTVVGSFGAAAVAADVEAGTIELLMVWPISRPGSWPSGPPPWSPARSWSPQQRPPRSPWAWRQRPGCTRRCRLLA